MMFVFHGSIVIMTLLHLPHTVIFGILCNLADSAGSTILSLLLCKFFPILIPILNNFMINIDSTIYNFYTFHSCTHMPVTL